MGKRAIKIKITGDDHLYKQFKQLNKLTQPRVLENAARAGALPIHNTATRMVPKVSGDLSRSLHIEKIDEHTDYVEVGIGSDKDYAARIEFGFMDYDSLGRYYNQAAQPYLRPALADEENKAVDEIGDALRIQLDYLLLHSN